jgi:TolB-like protein/Flp pilus assembly protein TadD
LPLQNLSGDPGQEYFADGMTEELISSMAKVGDLRVISRTSVMQYKGARKPLPQIARELNVDAIVEGSVLRSGDRVRITAQLIQGANDKHLWAETYDRDMHDVLDMQAEVAQAIARQIQIRVTPGEKQRLAQSRTVDPAVYEAYLRGRFAWNKRTAGDTWAALAHFQQATAIDPSFAPAYAGAADCYVTLWLSLDAMPRDEALPQARAAVQKALQLDSMLAEAHTTLGEILLTADWNWTGAEAEFKQAIKFNPGYATAHHWYGLYFSDEGRPQEARRELELARNLDPLSPIIQSNVGWTYYIARDYDNTIRVLQQTLARNPDFWLAHWGLGSSYVQKRQYADAVAELQKALELSHAESGVNSSLAYAQAAAGNRFAAEKILHQLQRTQQGDPVDLAIIYIALGNREQAIQMLQQAYREHTQKLLHLKTDPWLDPLRNDPRFQELIRKIGFD